MGLVLAIVEHTRRFDLIRVECHLIRHNGWRAASAHHISFTNILACWKYQVIFGVVFINKSRALLFSDGITLLGTPKVARGDRQPKLFGIFNPSPPHWNEVIWILAIIRIISRICIKLLFFNGSWLTFMDMWLTNFCWNDIVVH